MELRNSVLAVVTNMCSYFFLILVEAGQFHTELDVDTVFSDLHAQDLLKIVLVDHVDQVLVNALEIKNAKEIFKNRGERGTGIRAQYTGQTAHTH